MKPILSPAHRAGHTLLVLSLFVALAAVALSTPDASRASTITVNRTGDGANASTEDPRCDVDTTMTGRQCSLRAAIEVANLFSDHDTIKFAIPGKGVHQIEPRTELPRIVEPTLINGYSQPGARPNRKGLDAGDDAQLRIALSGAFVDSPFSR